VLGLVRALVNAGQVTRARSYRRDAVRVARPLDDPVLLARVITSFDVPRTWFSREYGQTDHELVGTVEQTLARLPPGDGPLRCRLLTTLAFELEGAESERGYQASAQAVEMARRLGDPSTLVMAMSGRWTQSFRHDGLAERLSLSTEQLALRGTAVTAEATGHLALMAASCGIADFAAADLHADKASRIAERYDLRAITPAISMYRAMRTALAGDMAAAGELYEQAGGQIDALGLRWHAVGVSALGRSSLLIMQDRVAEVADELDSHPGVSASFPALNALALAASGHTAEARAMAGPLHPIPRDISWLFWTGVRGLLGIAIDDRQRAESAYQALLPFADRPAGADTMLITIWPVAQILGDLARYLGLAGSEDHYRHALAIAEQARAQPWREAAVRHLK
jgi:hypothetical protein